MDLLNQTLDGFSSQISNEEWGFNSDIFEANLINLIILSGGLFYLLSNALSESLFERQQIILGTIQESEEKLQEATKRFNESERQLTQAQMVLDSIKQESENTASKVKSAILADGKSEIERLTTAARAQIYTIENRVRKQISDYVVNLALKRITMQLEGKLTTSLQQQIIERNISKLAD